MKKPVEDITNSEATVVSDNPAAITPSPMGEGGSGVSLIANPILSVFDQSHIIENRKSKIKN